MAPNSSPPGYSYPYPQPTGSTSSNAPSFRKRKSSTIIPISASSTSSSDSSSPSTSPARTTAILPDLALQLDHAQQQVEYNLHRASNTSIASSAPPSFKASETASPLPIPPYVNELERKLSSSSSSLAEEGEATPLLADSDSADRIKRKWTEGPLFVAGVKFSILFVVFTAVVVGTFWFGLPKLDPEDKDVLKLPRSFSDLQALNELFQKYKRDNPFRILICVLVTYLFIQTFTLPGSMYLSILFGAAYGPMKGLFLACFCDATGSVLCYTMSSIVGPPLLTIPFYRARVETWRIKLMGDPKKGKQASMGDIFAFLVVLRIAPFPPHWIPNFVAPHLGIGVGLFWLSCFIGIAPVSVIHVTIGSSLDTMTSAADFHLVSVKNVLGLIAVIVAVLIPVGLKRIFKKDLGDLGDAEETIEEAAVDSTSIDVPAIEDDGVPRRYQAIDSGVILAGPSRGDDNLDTGIASKGKGKGRSLEIIADIQEEEEEDNYEVFSTAAATPEMASIRNEKHRIGPVQGYGTIERVEDEERRAPGIMWPFAR